MRRFCNSLGHRKLYQNEFCKAFQPKIIKAHLSFCKDIYGALKNISCAGSPWDMVQCTFWTIVRTFPHPKSHRTWAKAYLAHFFKSATEKWHNNNKCVRNVPSGRVDCPAAHIDVELPFPFGWAHLEWAFLCFPGPIFRRFDTFHSNSTCSSRGIFKVGN